MCANGRLYVLSGNLSLLCAIKFVFASLQRLDVTDGFSLGALASRAFIVLEFVTESFYLPKKRGYVAFTGHKYGNQSYLLEIPASEAEPGEYGIFYMSIITATAIPVGTFSINK